MTDTTLADTIWLTEHAGPVAITAGSLTLDDLSGTFSCRVPDGRHLAGPLSTLLAWVWEGEPEPPEPQPEPEGPVGLLSDAHIDYVRARLGEGPNVWTDQAALIEQQRNQNKGTGGIAVPGRGDRDRFTDPAYRFLSYDAITLDEQGTGFADDGMAVFTLALWWRLFDDDLALGAAKAGLMGWVSRLAWFDAKTADGTARGKFWASTGLPRFLDGAALLWPHLSDEERAAVGRWAIDVFMDGRTESQNKGAVYNDAGEVIRDDTQGGGSLLDERAGPNHQAIYAGCFLRIGLILRETDPERGDAVWSWGLDYHAARLPTWIRENGPNEPVSESNGYPYPPAPDRNGWDTLDLLSQQWFLSLDENDTYGTNFLGGLTKDGLIADTSRDGAHAMFTLEAVGQNILVAHNNGVDIRAPRVGRAGEVQGKWANEATDECWGAHGGNWSALDGTGWLPSEWAEKGLGTRGGSSTGGGSSPSAPTFDAGGAGYVGGGWYVCHWIYHGQLGHPMPELTRVVERFRGVPDNEGGHAGARGPDGPSAGTATPNGSQTTPNGSPYAWGPFLFTVAPGVPVPA